MFIQNKGIALNILRNWRSTDNAISVALRRLSSGQRINSAADDAAGLGIAERMKALLSSNQAAQRCADQDISMNDIQDDAMGQVQSILQRMFELSSQSTNGTYSESDRYNLNAEYQQLAEEMNRISPTPEMKETTLFENEKKTKDDNAMVFQTNDISEVLGSLDKFLDKVNAAVKEGDKAEAKKLGIDLDDISISNSQKIRSAVAGFTVQNLTSLDQPNPERGAFCVTVSDNNVSIKMNQLDDDFFGLKGTNILTTKTAGEACDKVKGALKSASMIRGGIGATRNLMERTKDRLADMEINLTDSLSRILDADMAKEMMNLVHGQVLTQVNSFLMSQVKIQSESVLKLLQN